MANLLVCSGRITTRGRSLGDRCKMTKWVQTDIYYCKKHLKQAPPSYHLENQSVPPQEQVAQAQVAQAQVAQAQVAPVHSTTPSDDISTSNATFDMDDEIESLESYDSDINGNDEASDQKDLWVIIQRHDIGDSLLNLLDFVESTYDTKSFIEMLNIELRDRDDIGKLAESMMTKLPKSRWV